MSKYDIILRGQYYLRDLVESISLSESLNEISMRADIALTVTDDLQRIGVGNGDSIEVIGIPFGGSTQVSLLSGIVWDANSNKVGTKKLALTVYDRTIYLAKSDDEVQHNAGLTASQRIGGYCSKWGIPIHVLPDTGIQLPKQIHYHQKLYSMIQKDLSTSVLKGGDIYRPRMTPQGLELYKIGTNSNPYYLESDKSILTSISQSRTLEGAATRVKVMKRGDEGAVSSLIATAENSSEIAKYGTIQKIVSEDVEADEAQQLAEAYLQGVSETFRVECLCVNTIRAGDKIYLDGIELIVVTVKHDFRGAGKTTLDLESYQRVKRTMIDKAEV